MGFDNLDFRRVMKLFAGVLRILVDLNGLIFIQVRVFRGVFGSVSRMRRREMSGIVYGLKQSKSE